MKLRTLATLLAAGPILAALSPAVMVHAANDTTPPRLDLPASFSFVKGSTVTTEWVEDELWISDFDMKLTWTADDPSGICGYRTRMLDYVDPFEGPYGPWSFRKSLLINESDYTDQLGGGSLNVWAYQVQARDCRNNYTEKLAYTDATVMQDDGSTIDGPGDDDGTAPLVYSGLWAINSCQCWSAGTTHRTSASGASVQFTVTEEGREIGLVMEKAPDRGQFQIWVNGVLRTTVDTYAASKKHRTVVWTGRVPLGSTVRLTNLATPGRPRIDLDAILLDEAP